MQCLVYADAVVHMLMQCWECWCSAWYAVRSCYFRCSSKLMPSRWEKQEDGGGGHLQKGGRPTGPQAVPRYLQGGGRGGGGLPMLPVRPRGPGTRLGISASGISINAPSDRQANAHSDSVPFWGADYRSPPPLPVELLGPSGLTMPRTLTGRICKKWN